MNAYGFQVSKQRFFGEYKKIAYLISFYLGKKTV